MTSTRRSCPLTFSVIRRSTEPGADGCPSTGVVRNRYADDEATAPAAMTPLMKPRRDTDSDVCSDIFVSSIAGSPRRVEDLSEREGFNPETIALTAFWFNGSFTSLPSFAVREIWRNEDNRFKS